MRASDNASEERMESKRRPAPHRPRHRSLLGLTFIAAGAFELTFEPFSVDGTTVSVLDFSYHVNLVRASLLGDAGDPYDPATQLRVFSELVGSNTTQAMPVGLSPPALMFLLPFAVLGIVSLGAATSLWVACSVTALLWAVVDTLRRDDRPLRFAAIALPSLVSSCLLEATYLGQTSLAATAGLLFLLSERGKASARGAVLAFLSLKPVYFIPGALILIGRRERSALFACVGLLAAGTAVTLSLTGWSTLASYAGALRIYATRDVPAVYRDSIVFERMVTVATVVQDINGQALTVAMIAVLCGATILALQKRASEAAFISLAAFLILSPYLGSYEDVLLIAAAAAAAHSREASSPRRLSTFSFGASVVLAALYMNRSLVLPGAESSPALRGLLLAMKGALLVLLAGRWPLTSRCRTC